MLPEHPETTDDDRATEKGRPTSAEGLLTRTLKEVVETTDYPTTSTSTVAARSRMLAHARRRTTAIVAAAAAVVVVGGWAVVSLGHDHATSRSSTRDAHPAGPLHNIPQGATPRVAFLEGDAFVTAQGERVTAPVFRTATTAAPFGDGVLVAGPTTTQRPYATISLVSGGSTRRLGCGTPTFAVGSGDPAYWLSDGCRFLGPGRLFHGTTITPTTKGVIYSPVGSTRDGVVAVGTVALPQGAGSNGPVLIGPDGSRSRIPHVATVAAVSPSGALVVGLDPLGKGVVAELSTGAVQWRTRAGTLGHFSASGRYVVAIQNLGVQTAPGVGDVVGIRDAATGHQVMSTVLPNLSIVGRPVWEGDSSVLVVVEDRQQAAGDRACRRRRLDHPRHAGDAAGRGHVPPRGHSLTRGSARIATSPPSRRVLVATRGGTMTAPDRPPTGALAVADRNDARDADFAAYLAARQASLLRTAYLLTGNRHDAEDLTQTAFAKLYLSWDKVRDQGAIDGYVRRILVNEHNSLWRRAWKRREHSQEHPVLDRPVHDDHDDGTGSELWGLVQTLPRKARAVVVLRYYEELSEAETAATLGISVGTVKSQTSRALAALRSRTPQSLDPRGSEEDR